jgi:hypothetical protein
MLQLPQDALFNDEALQALEKIPDDVLRRIQFAMPWQSPTAAELEENKRFDEDGFPGARWSTWVWQVAGTSVNMLGKI